MSKIKIILTAVVALIIGVVIGAMFAPSNSNLGSVRFTADKFVGGLSVGTTDQLSISSTGVIAGKATTFTGISTLATTSVTSLCVFNGTQFTKISFSAGSATPAYATSTTCL